MNIFKHFILLALSFLSTYANADVQWQDKKGGLHAAPGSACLASKTALHQGTFRSDNMGIVKDFNRWRATCSWTHGSGSAFNIWTTSSCDSGKTFNLTTGTCKFEDPLNCAAKAGQPTKWKAEYDSLQAYDQNPIRCTTSTDGCAVDVCSSPSYTCQVEGKEDKFVCKGEGSFNGDPQAASTGPGVSGCSGDDCKPNPPQESSSSQDCSTPTTTNGVTTYRCVSESNVNEWSKANCSVGNVNGVQGLHCTSPDYVPEYDGKTRTDDVSEQSNADGGKTTTTNTTDVRTHCKAGNCTTSTTSSTTTTTTDGSGKVTGETSTCKGANCGSDGKPADSNEEEEQEEESPMPSGSLDGPQIADVLPAIGEDGDQSITESTNSYYDRISNAPIVAAFTSLAVPTGGSCRIGSASLFGGSVSFNHFCEIAPEVLGGLRYLFLAIWAWAAIRLFGTA